MLYQCPGQEKRNLKIENVSCISCGYLLEIFSDELKVKCPRCGAVVRREQLPSCVEWCKGAQECIGAEQYRKHINDKLVTLKQKLIKELEDYFAGDYKRINHAKKVMDFAEELLKQEDASWHIVIPASILHDVGIKAAEEKYKSSAGHYQEREGPAIARNILLRLGVKREDIEEVCEIIAHHHTPGKIDTRNFKVLYDADWLVNLKDECNFDDKDDLKRAIKKIFLTATGRKIAENIYIRGNE